ncbi:Uncharacterized protein Adt_18458 [Abeliophyllum distichum]|uniref:Uncharacterized protein n=1 Tax=Abeliophyllum distichum TaxID=126358 RepID=A0ABD1TJS6_9LAMI
MTRTQQRHFQRNYGQMMRQQQGVERSKATSEIKVVNQNVLEDKNEENIEELMKESIENECVGKSRFEHRKKDEDEDDSGRLITIQFGTLSPFQLTYGQEALLPRKINVQSIRMALQNDLNGDQYTEALAQSLLELDKIKLDILDKLQVQKQKMAKYYNRKFVAKFFRLGDLVWKTILLLTSKDPKYGKWSPNWEGPYRVENVLSNEAYHLEDLDGTKHVRSTNEKYLQKYVPSVQKVND